MPRWLSARGVVVAEQLSLGSGPDHSRPRRGAHRTEIKQEGLRMSIKTATQSQTQAKLRPAPRWQGI